MSDCLMEECSRICFMNITAIQLYLGKNVSMYCWFQLLWSFSSCFQNFIRKCHYSGAC